MNNYYTPTIEEFHVGFEYKIKHIIPQSQSTVTEWRNAIIEKANQIALVEIQLNTVKMDGSSIKVKYLDHEDILNLGWEFIGKSIDNWYKITGEFNMGNWTCYEIRMHCDYGNHKDHRMFIDAIDSGEEISIFKGIIKNKSEFKKLMNQLGIL